MTKVSILVSILIVGSVPILGHADDEAVTVSISPGAQWDVEFRTTWPVTRIKLFRTTDDSRVSRWTPQDGFVISHIDGEDSIHRQDNRRFSSVSVMLSPRYRHIPKEYAPFSPFTDGGLLFYSGRFHACGGECGDDSPIALGPWSISLLLPENSHAIVNSVRHAGDVQWLDRGDGTNVYIGNAEAEETERLIYVIDEALPDYIQRPLSHLFPQLLAEFTERLGPLKDKPTLFASLDPHSHRGFGHQGGTLPNQVFMHFYGAGWNAGENGNAFASAENIAFFFAHEAAHMFQHKGDIRPDDSVGWIHEGGAEAMALISMLQMELISDTYASNKVSRAYHDCAAALAMRSLSESTPTGNYNDHYTCGLLMHMAIRRAVKGASDGQRDLFDFWRSFVAGLRHQSDWTDDRFIALVEKMGDAETAAFLQAMTDSPQEDAEAFLREGLAGTGVSFGD